MTTTKAQAQDQYWISAYANAAELLFGKVEGDTLTDEQDEACIARADADLADATAYGEV